MMMTYDPNEVDTGRQICKQAMMGCDGDVHGRQRTAWRFLIFLISDASLLLLG